MYFRKFVLSCLGLLITAIAIYALGRLYFHLTAGFTLANISSDFTHQPEWEVRPLSPNENQELQVALDQSYRYLAKGCQSYVFISQDERFVIKFFKYQRFRIQPWLAYFPPLPAIVQYRQEKEEKKWKKLDGFIKSWKVAFDHIKDESGLIFVHLNKTNNLQRTLTIVDKLGMEHSLNLDQMEFCVQHRAEMLEDVIMEHKKHNDLNAAKQLINNLLGLILSEYSRGLADNDHALMQNTGVVQGKPIHIDVGQFVINEEAKMPLFYHQELFSKTYRLKQWLRKNYPELGFYLDHELSEIIGPNYNLMHPIWWDKK